MDRVKVNITVEEAKELLKQNLYVVNPIKVKVRESLGYILSRDVISPVDLPLFSTSAADGYALNVKDFETGEFKFKLIGSIKAGETKRIKIKEGEAIKVFTGSPLPTNANAVAMIEDTDVINGEILVKKKIEMWENIRFKGEEIKKGEIVLKKGTEITPGVIGFLSAMGIDEVFVIRKPRVSVIVTGSEIAQPGEKIKYGQIYDANSNMIYSVLRSLGIREKDIKLARVKDDFGKIRKKFIEGLKNSDVIIFSGGVSAGDYDFVRDLMSKENVKRIFYKVKQKPGKPLFFGKKGKVLIFGLPGNPAAVLTCMIEYVIPALKFLMGHRNFYPKEEIAILQNKIKKKSDRLYFLKGYFENGKVTVLPNQESHMLSSFAMANCLIIAPKEKTIIEQGEEIKVHLL